MADSTTTLAPKLISAYDRSKLGHALILKILGQEELSIQHKDFFSLVQSLQCTNKAEHNLACGNCDSCKLLELKRQDNTQAHTDSLWLEPKNETGYAVEQIRELSRFLSLKGNISENRVIWINRAEKLFAGQGAPANALLKILEEPRPNCFIILSSKQPELLLPTIRSRGQQFVLQSEISDNYEIPSEWAELKSWLQNGAQPKATFNCPCDQESFWKDRKQALEEITKIQTYLWKESKVLFNNLNRDESFRVLDFFSGMQNFVISLKSYSNATLQWLNFKLQARQGLLWKQ